MIGSGAEDAVEYTVRPGDCLSSIAARFGFSDYRVIYDHGENEAFRARRKDPNVIHPGDRIFIPDRAPKDVECPTGREHRFEVKLPRRELRVVLLDPHGEPIANKPYKLVVGGRTIEKKTDGSGLIHEVVPVDADEATLTIQGLKRVLRIGALNPTRDAPDGGVSGIKARLTNLGFDTMGLGGAMDEDTRDAIRAFQDTHGLEVTGEVDDALIAKLHEKYPC
jgi:hypothetical protein